LGESGTEAVQVPGVKKYLEATQDALLTAFREELDLFGREEAEGFHEAEDAEVACS
jgi:hypothetical protein